MVQHDVAITIDGFFGRGGTERQIIDIASGLVRRGRTVSIVSRWPLDRGSEQCEELAAAGVPIIDRQVPSPSVLLRAARRAVPALKSSTAVLERDAYAWQNETLRALAPAVVHEIPYFGRMPDAAVEAYRELRRPVVHTILGTPADPVVPAADWAVMTTDGAPAIAGVHAGLTWIPCTTPTSFEAAPVPPLEGQALRVLFVGRLVMSKGLDVLITALTRVRRPVHLTVVGYGDQRTTYEEQLAASQVSGSFLGSLPRVRVIDALRDAHLLAVPSRSANVELREGMPTVIAEAMAQARPVLATAVGGIPHLFNHEPLPGWLIQPDDADGLASQIDAIDDEQLSARGAAAAEVFRQQLDPEVVLDRYERCYEQARTALPA